MNMPLWFSNLVFWSAQAALLVLAAALLARFLRIRQPGVLLVYWRALLALSLLLPFLQPWHRPKPIAMEVASISFEPAPSTPAPSSAVSRWHLPSLQSIAAILGIVILAGIAVRLVILALGLWKLRRLRKSSLPIASPSESFTLLETARSLVHARAEFRLSSQVDSPVTFGFLAPLILLPERFSSLEPRFQSAIACHELLHVRRHDWAQHLGEEFLRAAFWFHPAIAWLVSRVRLAREQVVDLEVVNLMQARKPYLEALLEFTNARAAIAAIPAPLFLAESQLVERIALMLKEVRMSRTRLVASLTAISCCLALVIFLAAWTFPLKAAPRTPQSAPKAGIAGGVSGGVSDGVTPGVPGGVSAGVRGGVAGGITGESSTRSSAEEPNVDYSTIWIDTVKRGPMLRQVRGLGQLVRAENSSDLIARVTVPEAFAADLRLNEHATIHLRLNGNAPVDVRRGLMAGHVIRISPESNDARQVEVALDVEVELDASRPPGFTAGAQIDATIDIEKLDDILQIGRPVHVTANSAASVFKIVHNGEEAERVEVKFGRASVSTIEVLSGLQPGDKVILSDMSDYANAERIRLTNEKHVTKH